MIQTPATQKQFALTPLAFAILSVLALSPKPLQASPTGGVVVDGSAQIIQNNTVTNINQSTEKAAINWQGFSVAGNESVNFHQPDASAITLNRVIGNEKSVIEGALNANGQIFIINSNGILFTKGSSVNAAGLVASTLDIRQQDFEAGRYIFHGNAENSAVINMGTLTAADGGYVALLGKEAINQGVIVATRGTVDLSAGQQITLNFNGDSLMNVSIDQGELDALVANQQAIYAEGGKVLLTARAADKLLSSQVNNSGVIEAQTLGDLKGEIIAHAYGGTAHIDGTLDASAPQGGDGGFIETSGDTVKIADHARITTQAHAGKTGQWLIDPDGFVIANQGGDVTASFLSNLLSGNTTNFSISSTTGQGSGGNIDVNDAIAWNSNATFTLQATHNININATITASGDTAGLTMTAGNDININKGMSLSGDHAALAMNYTGDYHILTPASFSGTALDANGNPVAKRDTSGGEYGSVTLSGAHSTLQLNNQSYFLIHSMDDLAAISGNTGNYALAQNLDAADWSRANVGTTATVSFLSGILTGLGHTVDHLTLQPLAQDPNQPAPSFDSVGLISSTDTGTIIRDIGVTHVDITGGSMVGALAGSSMGSISNAYSTGVVRGDPLLGHVVGGLVGGLYWGEIDHAFSTASVSSAGTTGGLIGWAWNSYLNNVHATGNVSGMSGVQAQGGGLIGMMQSSSIDSAYALGNVTGDVYSTILGGLVGDMSGGDADANGNAVPVYITNSFATGNVTGGTVLGGLVGHLSSANGAHSTTTFDNDYATGNISGNFPDHIIYSCLGGFIGCAYQDTGSVIFNNTHASGNISVSSNYAGNSDHIGNIGGLIGFVLGDMITVTNSGASGNIYAPNADTVGGLIGMSFDAVSLTFQNNHATGNVIGHSSVGGLFGSVTSNGYNSHPADIKDSYSSGHVSGTGIFIGGVAGLASNANIDQNVYYNNDGVSNGIGNTGNYLNDAGTNHSQGLNDNQFSDIDHYLDGSISQIQAIRAETAQANLTREETHLSQLGSTRMSEAQRLAIPSADANIAATASAPSLDDHIVLNDTNYSANIKQIEVDGVVYQLEEKDKPQ